MLEERLIDTNALIKDIAESIRLADEWKKESGCLCLKNRR